MAIKYQTYTLKINNKDKKANRANPVERIDEIIGVVRKHYENDMPNDPYLFVNDIELVGGGALLKGADDLIEKFSVASNGNSQIRRMILESELREFIEAKTDGTTGADLDYYAQPLVEHDMQPEVDLYNAPTDALVQQTDENENNEYDEYDDEYGEEETAQEPHVAQTNIELRGLDGGIQRIKCLITQKEILAAKGRHKIPQTLDEVKAALQPMVEVEREVKKKAIHDLCMAYTQELIKRNGLTKQNLQETDRYAYREPRRMLYSQFERIFASHPAMSAFLEHRELTEENDVAYIDNVYNAGLINQLHMVAQALFEDYSQSS
jgi:hypothetical protein